MATWTSEWYGKGPRAWLHASGSLRLIPERHRSGTTWYIMDATRRSKIHGDPSGYLSLAEAKRAAEKLVGVPA